MNRWRAKPKSRRAKWQVLMIGAAIGIMPAWAQRHCPSQAALIQMATLSFAVPGIVVWGLWSYRRKPRFIGGLILVTALHGLVLYAVRPMLPFGSGLTLITLIFLECLAGCVVVLRLVLGRNEIPRLL